MSKENEGLFICIIGVLLPIIAEGNDWRNLVNTDREFLQHEGDFLADKK